MVKNVSIGIPEILIAAIAIFTTGNTEPPEKSVNISSSQTQQNDNIIQNIEQKESIKHNWKSALNSVIWHDNNVIK